MNSVKHEIFDNLDVNQRWWAYLNDLFNKVFICGHPGLVHGADLISDPRDQDKFGAFTHLISHGHAHKAEIALIVCKKGNPWLA